MARFLPFLLSAILCGCAAKAAPVAGRAAVAIAEEAKGAGRQSRTIPWAATESSAGVRFRMLGEAAAGATPGVQGAAARLRARGKALELIAADVAKLPAAEPPPGERERPSVGQLAARSPAVAAKLAELLRKESREELVPGDGGDAVLKVAMPMRPVAELVLEYGGGFTDDDKLAQQAGPRRRAAEEAMRRANAELLEAVLRQPLRPGTTMLDWVNQRPENKLALQSALAEVRTLRSEARPAISGKGEEWVVELEFDPAEIAKQAKAQLPEPKKPAKEKKP